MKKIAVFAAAMMAASAASAADLGSKKPAVAADYVKVCDAYGAGYFYIPGGETCLKIGGYVRAQYSTTIAESGAAALGGGAWNTRGGNGTTTLARAALNFDARTNTEGGLLRSFAQLFFNHPSGGPAGITVDRAFIQWGGLTAGRTGSMFSFFTGNANETNFGTASEDITSNLLAYTASFGNGLSATLSLEDATFSRRNNDGFYGGHKLPDLVANVNVAQAWGSAQVMGAVHQMYNATGNSKAGYAVGAGVTVNIPALGAGSSFSLQAAYADGAVAYLSDAHDYVADYDVSGGRIRAATGFSIAGGVNVVINPKLSLALDASYLSIDPFGASNTVKAFDVASTLAYEATPGLVFSANVDYRNQTVGTTPVAGLAKGNAVAGTFRIQRNF